MKVTRREALKQLVMVSAGMALLPSCMQDKSKAAVILKHMTITADQEAMLAELSETIIPRTDTPGAKDISAHLFVLKMMDDCYSKADQHKFMEGMTAFNQSCKKQYGHAFADCSMEQRNAFLQKAETDSHATGDEPFFYHAVKHLTVQAYTTSKFYLTNINIYKLVPGRYHGCVPVNNAA